MRFVVSIFYFILIVFLPLKGKSETQNAYPITLRFWIIEELFSNIKDQNNFIEEQKADVMKLFSAPLGTGCPTIQFTFENAYIPKQTWDNYFPKGRIYSLDLEKFQHQTIANQKPFEPKKGTVDVYLTYWDKGDPSGTLRKRPVYVAPFPGCPNGVSLPAAFADGIFIDRRFKSVSPLAHELGHFFELNRGGAHAPMTASLIHPDNPSGCGIFHQGTMENSANLMTPSPHGKLRNFLDETQCYCLDKGLQYFLNNSK